MRASRWSASIFVSAATAAALTACVAESVERQTSIALDEPRVTSGVMVEGEEERDRLAEAIERLEAQRAREATRRASEARRAGATGQREARTLMPEAAPGDGGAAAYPQGSGRAMSLTRLSETELNELIEVLSLKYRTEMGYSFAAEAMADFLPRDVEGMTDGVVLARNAEDGLRLIRLAGRRYLSQASQLLVRGLTLGAQEVSANPDVQRVDAWVEEGLASIEYMRQDLPLAELEAQVVQLSYVDAASALDALRRLGVNAAQSAEDVPETVTFEQLPFVSAMPAPDGAAMALVGGTDRPVRDPTGLYTIPTAAQQLGAETVSGPSSQLLVLFHPAHPEQHSRALRLLEDLIDVPARQVFIEGMVVEIGEEGLRELGVEWQFQDGPVDLRLGSLVPGQAEETVDLAVDDDFDLSTRWAARLRALVTESKAEILSRPSVVTLDNRQATIRVGTDIPVATSQEGLGGGASKISFDFRYIPTGILLNVRPRIDSESEQISMQIDTTVSSTVLGQDLEVRSEDGTLLASAPTIASRRVQTYARIPNNTPLIIGGLVSREENLITEKVPLLGDIPLIGNLFKSQRREENKREVIIVLTPYVLPEGTRLGRMNPKSEDVFDLSGYELHRDVHRLREAEVFDLTFLTTNTRLVSAKRNVNELVRRNFRFGSRAPFESFVGDKIPGEHILVERMMYEVIKNLELVAPVAPEQIIYFAQDPSAGYKVRFLEELLAGHGDGVSLESFFGANPDKALALRYRFDREVARPGALGTERIPEVALVDCVDREDWGRLLWELNQPDAQGRTTATILLHRPEDLVRLRRAIVLKKMVQLNGGMESLRLNMFRVGTMLQLPELPAEDIQVVDSDVARLFFHTEHYYSASIDRIERSLARLQQAMAQPEVRVYLEDLAENGGAAANPGATRP